MDAIARQPEAADKVQAAMLIACGLIEGAGLIGLIFMSLMKTVWVRFWKQTNSLFMQISWIIRFFVLAIG